MLTSDAIISDDKKYRYLLTRIWDNDKRMVNFIGLNPSTADQIDNDPTMRRELIEGNYRIFYRLQKEKITILRIHNAARKIK